MSPRRANLPLAAMEGSASDATRAAEPSAASSGSLARALGVSPEGARRLVAAGYETPEAVRALSAKELGRLGLAAGDLEALQHAEAAPVAADAAAEGSADAERIVERWVGSVAKAEKTRRRRFAPAGKGSTEVLRRWVEGDDHALEEWIRSSEAVPPSAGTVPAPAAGAGRAGPGGGPGSAAILEREATVVRWLTDLLDRVKSDQFDPTSVVQEVQELQRQLYDERAKRKELEDEVEHVKRGSIAVIKYVRAREAKEREAARQAQEEEIARLRQRLASLEGPAGGPPTAPAAVAPRAGTPAAAVPEARIEEAEQKLREEFAGREQGLLEREAELRRRIVQLEGEARRLHTDADQAREQAKAAVGQGGVLDAELARRLTDADRREHDLIARDNAIRAKFEEIRIGTEEITRRRGQLEFKEKELAGWDQQLETRRAALDLEARRLEDARRELGVGTVAGASEAQRLDDLRQELNRKEVELKAREGQLAERMRELERLASTAATGEADRMLAESTAEAKTARVHSGVRRLDDLLYGGYFPGVQLLVNGPAHTGKDTLARLFSVEGLRSGIPSLWIVTDKTHGQVRDDLTALFPQYPEAERKGLVRYIDLYSLSVGATSSAPGVRLLSPNDKGVLEQLAQATDAYAEQLKERFSTYRLIFESVSTVAAYLDTAATFRFLQPLIGRRKLDGAVGYYELESGMHSESDLETLEHMVDGSINLKLEQMKPFLQVRGIGEAQARSWIGYTFTKRSFNLGSFSLEHIR